MMDRIYLSTSDVAAEGSRGVVRYRRSVGCFGGNA